MKKLLLSPLVSFAALLTWTVSPIAATGKVPTIKYFFIAQTANPDDLQLVQDELNRLVSAKIGANVELHTLTFQEVTTKLPLLLASGDDADVVSLSTFAPYNTAAATGGLLPLDDLLKKFAPDTFKKYSAEIWNATRIDGKILMVPSYNPQPSWAGVWARKDLTDKYNFDWRKPTRWEDWEPFFDKVLAGEKGVAPILSGDEYWGRIWFPNYWDYDSVDKGVGAPKAQGILGVKVGDKARKIVATPFTKDYEDAAKLIRKWYLKGYVLKTPPTGAEMNAMRGSGKFATFLVPFVSVWDTKGMSDNEWSGIPILQAPLQRSSIITTGSVTGSGNAVTKVSKNPEAALRFINEMHANAAVHNLLNYGILGKHYVFTDKAKGLVALPEGVTGLTASYNPNTYWQFGVNDKQYKFTENDLATAQRAAAAMKNARFSPVMGFSPNRANVQNQIAAVASVCQEYGEPIEFGLVDPADPQKGLEVFRAKLKEAGIDAILQDFQKQIDDWAKANTK